MLKTERKQLILEELNQHHVVSLEKLVSLLETSESTVRRDLDELEAENKLRRVHGGAELPHSLQEEETIQEKSVKNLQEKKLIAQKAASLIKEKDVIFVDAGSTTAFLIKELERKDITVVTNSIHHAVQLVDKQIPTVIIGGGVSGSACGIRCVNEGLSTLIVDKSNLLGGSATRALVCPMMPSYVRHLPVLSCY